MKANEAPEKIYAHWSKHTKRLCASAAQGKGDIEYTRTDAFIEKAVKFINKANLYLYHCISEECDYVDTDKFTENFRNYMKGE